MIYRGQGFLPAVVWICSLPTPSPLSRLLARPATHRKTEKDSQYADRRLEGKGVGEELNYVTQRRIRLIEGNAKSLRLKSNHHAWERTLRQLFFFWSPPPLNLYLGVNKQFCRIGIWSNIECKSPAVYGLQHNTSLPLHTLYTVQ
jgi:hypothetical protein